MVTQKAYQTLAFIKQYIRQYQYAPTCSEIAEGIGIQSRGVVHRYLKTLADARLIRLLPNCRRNIELVEEENSISQNAFSSEQRVDELPILGKIAAGLPIEAITDQLSFSFMDTFSGPERFLLKVQGDSMLGDNICDGDLIICESCDVPLSGKIMVVLIDYQDTTLKRLKLGVNGTVTLIPSNPAHSTITYDARRVQVQGVYLGLVRSIDGF